MGRPAQAGHPALRVLLALLLGLVATEAWAVVLYKLTDRSGRVTYVDVLPEAFDGTVERLDIDTRRDRAAAPRESEDARIAGAMKRYEEIIRDRPRASAEEAREARIRQAQERLAAAQGALAAAQESSSLDDWILLNPRRNPLGMHRAPRPEYQARLEALEANVARAQEELRAAERS